MLYYFINITRKALYSNIVSWLSKILLYGGCYPTFMDKVVTHNNDNNGNDGPKHTNESPSSSTLNPLAEP